MFETQILTFNLINIENTQKPRTRIKGKKREEQTCINRCLKVEQLWIFTNCNPKAWIRKPNLKFQDSLQSLSKNPKVRKRGKRIKSPHKIIAKTFKPASPRPGTALLCLGGRSCHPARPARATFLAGCAAWLLSARPCALMHARALACFARVALFLVPRASSNLYSSP